MGKKNKKKNEQKLFLMVRDRENPLEDFKWATQSEMQSFKERGFVRLKEE